ncbi:MAG: D-alanine--D-alanine ligase [Chloroflexi bacterium]|nr:D-alanine--D-alanine ligase [Chloroflexota bacterium]
MGEKQRIRVGVIFGGRSGEHEVSLISAASVMAALDPTKYEVIPIGITKTGRWVTTGDPMALLKAEARQDMKHLEAQIKRGASPESGTRELVPGTQESGIPTVDVIFPVLHGPFGEDGTVQGLLELADIPYVGAGVLGSALGMDKIAQKAVFVTAGLPVCKHMPLKRKAWRADPNGVIERVESTLGYPCFVKPANLGSSVGISKVRNREELIRALDIAARYDRKMLVEEAIDAREIECSVLGNDEPEASVLGEIVPCNEFYDYEAKYLGDSQLIIPADLPPQTTEYIRSLAIRAFLALDLAGMARVDFFVSKSTGRVYVSEVNTIPGFTPISMYPKLWEASGLPYPRLLDRLIELALERYQDTRQSQTYYNAERLAGFSQSATGADEA